jgi:hypothetical protein
MALIVTGEQLLTIRSNRVAVVPTILYKKELYFLFGISAEFKELCDTGGGVKKTENSLIASFRELSEETCGIFDNILTLKYLSSCIAVILPEQHKKIQESGDGGMSVIFAPIDTKYLKITDKLFEQASKLHNKKENKELERLLWVKESMFFKLLDNTEKDIRMWSRLRHFYKNIYTLKLKKKIMTDIEQRNSQDLLFEFANSLKILITVY